MPSKSTGHAARSIFRWFMPEYPDTTRWLSQDQQEYAQRQLSQDAVGETDGRHAVSPHQAVKMAFGDYRLYLFMLLNHLNLLAQFSS